MQRHEFSNILLNSYDKFYFDEDYYFLCFMSTEKIQNQIILALFSRKQFLGCYI